MRGGEVVRGAIEINQIPTLEILFYKLMMFLFY
jgi:hypothetical protein